jgi:hypothetical protein
VEVEFFGKGEWRRCGEELLVFSVQFSGREDEDWEELLVFSVQFSGREDEDWEELLVFSVQFSGREDEDWEEVLVFSVQFSVFRKNRTNQDLGFAGLDAADETLEHGGYFAGFLDHLARSGNWL